MKPFLAIALADLHCGSPRLDPFHFQACVERYILPKITPEVTHLFICGDFFDLLINMNSLASMVAMTVISELKQACAKAQVKLRILRGTFTHDRNQPKHFLVTSPEYNDYVKLYDTLSIEYDEDVGMNFLYMPDNLPYSDIPAEVEKLLEAHSLKTVDVVIHHGYFKHMLPPGIPEPNGTLDVSTFKRFYTGCVLNGHVHISSIHENVLSIGSFDRIAYGEEEPKGFYLVSRTNENVYTFEFVENKDANPFWTADLRGFAGDHPEAAFDYFENTWFPKLKQAEENKQTVHLRLLTDNSGISEGCQALVRDHFNSVVVNRMAATKREQEIQNLNLCLDELPEITPENLEDLLYDLLDKKGCKLKKEELHGVLKSCKEDR